MAFDTIGGDALFKAFSIVKPGGHVISISGVPDASLSDARPTGWRNGTRLPTIFCS